MNNLGVNGTSRASFHVYNTLGDVDKLIKRLKEIKNKFD